MAYKKIKKVDYKLNWKQTKKKYPKLKPYGDTDLDGTLNLRDCKPLDASKDGIFGRALGIVSKGKYGQTKEQYKSERLAKRIARRSDQKIVSPRRAKLRRIYKQMPGRRLAETIHRKMDRPAIIKRKKGVYTTAGGVTYRTAKVRKGGRGSGVGSRTGRPGRPKGSYTYRHPITGKPIHVWEYRKVVRALKQRNKAIAELRDQKEQMALAKRGIPPEQAKVLIDARQIRSVSTGNEGVIQEVPQVQAQVQAQAQQVQHVVPAEVQRIQTQVQPWEREAAMRRLMRQQQIRQMDQQQNQMQAQNTEVSLLDGRVRPRDVTAMQRREKWTYS